MIYIIKKVINKFYLDNNKPPKQERNDSKKNHNLLVQNTQHTNIANKTKKKHKALTITEKPKK